MVGRKTTDESNKPKVVETTAVRKGLFLSFPSPSHQEEPLPETFEVPVAVGASNIECRPFPEVKTPRYHARWGGGIAHYAVYHGERILGTFVEKERAIEYADFYVTRNLRLKRFRYEERKEDPYYRGYDTGHDLTQWVRIKPIGEKGE